MTVALDRTWIDRAISYLSPRWGLGRARSRIASDLLARHYEAASTGRRTQGWRKSLGDADASAHTALAPLRELARDLVRNNPFAENGLDTIVNHTVGWGILASERSDKWLEWSESTACDADGRNDFYGLQKLVMRTVVESGECLVRLRVRRPEDELPIPGQLQVLEPDFLDTLKDREDLPNGGRIVQGVEFDALGRRVAYWLFGEHPGSMHFSGVSSLNSRRVPAEGVLHVFRGNRSGQTRGVSWFAPALLKFKDFDEFDDATLMKQKIAACLAVITTDLNGDAPALGTATAGETSADHQIDTLEPGMILNVPPGREIEVVSPPSVREYDGYSKTQLRAIAAGIGVTYEDLTGDYSEMSFSSARMSRIRHWAKVDDWRWRIVVPQFLDPVWKWISTIGGIVGAGMAETTVWNPPPMPMIEPDKEGLAIARNIRAGIQTHQSAVRERGYQWEPFLDEYQAGLQDLDSRGIVLDSDPRKMTQAGQAQQAGGQQPAEGET